MTIDRWILTAAWVICISALWIAVPREKWREAAILFVFNQAITWMLSLVQVEARLVDNPIREFPIAIGSNFTFNFMLYPTVSVLFALYYPKKGLLKKFLYLVLYSGCLTYLIMLVANYTQLIKLIRFPWWTVFPLALAVFYATRKYYEWYFRLQLNKRGDSA